MSRSQRLLNLIQILRRYKYPVTATTLAAEMGISIRTLYRDIATLQEQGANIEGAPGLGYVLRPGFTLPPLMFTEEEIEALVLGSRWVGEHADARLSAGAKNALAKIASVLPADLRNALDANALLIGRPVCTVTEIADLSQIRLAIRSEHKVTIHYRDQNDVESTRTIWPFALGYFAHVRLLIGWCELRQEFRHFRTDRILSLTVEKQHYPRRRQALLKEWRAIENIPLNTADRN